MRVVFMGTPHAAVPTLRAVHEAFDVVAVYTRPDTAQGRGLRVGSSPVKVAATDLGLRIEQPKSLKSEAAAIRALEPDVLLVVAYGAILRPDVLAAPKLGPVNVHFSLLPRWRGAAPVERAILAGDETTGVTTMLMDEGLDTGPILLQQSEVIRPDDTTDKLRDRLADLGASLAVETLRRFDEIEPQVQPADGSTYAAKIEPDEGKIDLIEDATMSDRRVRALNAFVMFRGKRLKVSRADLSDGSPALPNGLHLTEVQPEGKRRMSGEEFARGYRPQPDDFA